MTVSALRHSDTARSRFRVAIASRGLSSVRSVSSFADTWNSLRRPVPRHKQDDTSAAASTGRRQFSSHGPTGDGTPRALVNGETVAAKSSRRFCATNSAPTTSPTSVCGKAWTISMRSAGRFKPSPAVSRATRHSGSMSTSTSRCYSALPCPSPSARSDIRESKSMTCA